MEEALLRLRETEGQLVQSEKLAAVGQLSAAILHEINNPLNYSISALFALSKRLRRSSKLKGFGHDELIDDLKDGLKRVSSIVSDLSDFTHPDTGKRVDIRLSEALSVARRLVAQRLKDEEVELNDDLFEDCYLLANKNLLIQVFINIYQNACDAVSEQEEKRIDVSTEIDMASGMVAIELRDNGPGIESKHLPRLFDPFFTTKEVGKGTGLGLSICYRLIKDHGGDIIVSSALGVHTTFTVTLPLHPSRQGEETLEKRELILAES